MRGKKNGLAVAGFARIQQAEFLQTQLRIGGGFPLSARPTLVAAGFRAYAMAAAVVICLTCWRITAAALESPNWRLTFPSTWATLFMP